MIGLPPGPSMPRPLQTLAWVTRPGPWMSRLRERYGDAFTISIGHEPNWVMLADPEAVREVFTGDPAIFHAGEANGILRPLLGDASVLLLDGAEHMKQRKLLLPSFHGDRLKRWAALMTEAAEREIAGWRRGEPLSVRPRMQAVTLEIVLRTVFGVREGDRLEALRKRLRRTLELTSGPGGMALMAALGPRRIAGTRIFRREVDPVDELIYSEIRARREASDLGDRDDILSLLLQATHDDGSPMTDSELRDELLTLLVAGHETTATALAWAVERLARHPQAWARLRADGEPWADAVVKETLRLRPVLPVVVRKLTQDHEVAGMQLPKGAVVAPCIYLLHRREDVYPEPSAFRPERFESSKPGTYTWIPFGGGVRRCLGAAFAEMEMRAVLGVLARHATLTADDPAPERVTRRAITLVPSRGGRIVLA